MSDIKLFRVQQGEAEEIKGQSSELEKPLQRLIEGNLEPLLGVRFIASEYSTGKKHGGRIDTLGLDENACPVIVEYKRSQSENVINQGLYYLDWLMDHRAEFWRLTLERHGKDVAEGIDWISPRLICIAADFTKYDEHAVHQINRNIELLRYRKFGEDLLLLELANAVTASTPATEPKLSGTAGSTDKPFSQAIQDAAPTVQELYSALKDFAFALGDDVQLKELKLYQAFKRLKNFVCVVAGKQALTLTVKLSPDTVSLEQGFSRDVRHIGHWGTGDLELTLKGYGDLEKAKPLIQKAYEGQ